MNDSNKNRIDLEERLIEFAVEIITIVEGLPDTRPCTHLGNQLLRSGTSAALNYGEGREAESRRDFIHKFKVILKELRETLICLKILDKKRWLRHSTQIQENKELVAIFTSSVKTAKSRLKKE